MSVEVENLTKRFTVAKTPAVADASFNAPGGAITALIGPSGAGKSTTLRLIAGLERPDSGRILLEGQDCSAVPVQDRGIGFVFQNYALFNHMTVRQNVGFALSVRKVQRPEIRERVKELLELVQLDDLGDRYPRQLSGGQRQRVAFARALAARPRVLLLDEPFGALDSQVRTELRDWLERLHSRTHLTTLLITHDQSEALEVSEHVVVMLDGRAVQAGPPQEVYEHPASPSVAAFFGGATRFNGKVRSGRAELGSLTVAVPDDAEDGQAVEAFVRSHDVRLTATQDSGPGSSPLAAGRVVRLKVVGGRVKVSLVLGSGEPMNVEMDAAEFHALGATQGDTVFVNVRCAKIFVSDYVI